VVSADELSGLQVGHFEAPQQTETITVAVGRLDDLIPNDVPVEVIKMALPLVQPRLQDLGLKPRLRQKKDGSGVFLTDEGNYILDCASGRIDEPESLAAELKSIVGVVEHGLFLGMATLALVAGDDRVKEYR
jgi:ribose 5-phosphate isomerase A